MNITYSPVAEFNLLKDLQDRTGYENFADRFGLTEYADLSGLVAGWSDDPAFTGRLIPFAQATCGGSFYALWKIDDRTDLATLAVAKDPDAVLASAQAELGQRFADWARPFLS